MSLSTRYSRMPVHSVSFSVKLPVTAVPEKARNVATFWMSSQIHDEFNGHSVCVSTLLWSAFASIAVMLRPASAQKSLAVVYCLQCLISLQFALSLRSSHAVCLHAFLVLRLLQLSQTAIAKIADPNCRSLTVSYGLPL